MRRVTHRLYIVFCIVWLFSCSSVKFVEDGDYLLDNVIIESDIRRYNAAELKPYLHQQPNFKSFSLMKWQLYVYNWSGANADKWINKQLRRMGEPPVILDTASVEQSVEELKRFLTNKGYANAQLSASIDTARRKKAIVTYRITGNEPYVIRNYTMTFDHPEIDSIAHLKPPPRMWIETAFRSASNDYAPVVKEGDLFDHDLLDKERQRITTLLRRNGYYAFNKDNLGYLADSSYSNRHVVDLEMRLYPYRRVMPNGNTEELPHRPYYIKDVTVLTDYDPIRMDGDEPFIPTETVETGTTTIIYGKSGRTIRPDVLRRSNYLMPGNKFNERSLEQTYSSFASLRALRNVNIRFSETEENDTMKLSATILTSSAKLHGFGVDIEGTNSAGDLGFASSMNYQHRNLFKGSEVFSVKIRGAYESLSGNTTYGLNNYWEIGGETALTFPRFLLPFTNEGFRRRIHASTEFNLSYNRQTRPEYERAIVSGKWRYNWQSRRNLLARHSFSLVDVDYLFLPRINADFKELLPVATRQYNYIDQFIVSSSYSYSFNNYDPRFRQRNTHSLRTSIELAGNTLYVLSNLTNVWKGDNGRYKLFGIEYSQYAKFDLDFSKGFILDSRSRLAFHLGAGIAVPYGNADQIPFDRRYFSGGANSVRGWSVRSLGPGSMSKDSADFIRQSGDIRLDVNLEYRTKLFWRFELAAYVDAGNIWTIRPYASQENGSFSFTRFYREIAFSYGLGLRLDLDFVLFRFDTGFKAYDPQVQGDRRWAISHPGFSDNFAWHFAVGYPF